jgi:hypothetical protein
MNSLRLTFNFFAALIILSVLAPACEAIAATNAPATASVTLANKVAGTNSVSTNAADALVIPLSVFDLTAKPTRDPFFPLSTRQPIPAATNAAPAFSITEFTLKGLSGAAHNRLALINNRTFGEGESDELVTASGKVKVQCVEIKESSVVIRVGARHETMEVFLRKAAQ